MCECGCGDGMTPDFTFPGPEGVVYAIALYPGCRDCTTPAGIILYEIPAAQLADDDSDWGPRDWREELRWNASLMPSTREVAIPVARPEDWDSMVKSFDVEDHDLEGEYVHIAHKAFAEFRRLQSGAPAVPTTETKTP